MSSNTSGGGGGGGGGGGSGNLPHHLTDEELAEFKEIFDLVDEDHGGICCLDILHRSASVTAGNVVLIRRKKISTFGNYAAIGKIADCQYKQTP